MLWGVSVWGVGLAVRQFLCAGKYIAPLIEYERGGPQHLNCLIAACPAWKRREEETNVYQGWLDGNSPNWR